APAPSCIYPLSLHDALPISSDWRALCNSRAVPRGIFFRAVNHARIFDLLASGAPSRRQTSIVRAEQPHCFASFTSDFFIRFSKRSEEHTSELQSPYDLVCRL